MFGKKRIIWIVALGAVLVIGAAGALWLSGVLFGNGVKTEGYVYLRSGSSYSQLMDSLDHGDRLSRRKAFMACAVAAGLPDKSFGGAYRLKKGMSNRDIARMFLHSLQAPVRLTFNNIRTADQLAGSLSRHIEADSLHLRAVLTSDTVAAAYGLRPETIIAMFIPNTYEVYWDIAPRRLCDKMNAEYRKFWNDKRESLRLETGLTRTEVSTLASIVYEETKKVEEMPRVAGVYINRLKIGMPLQADPTVKFAIGDFAIKRVTREMLAVKSPYNTYKNTGLPPGPICMPSIVAIDAVLNYERHKYLYFCAREDFSGYHNFASTLNEHNANARRYTRALNRNNIR